MYALEEDQLKELLEKNISFDFFQLKAVDSTELLQQSDKPLLKKAKLKSPEEIMSELQTANLKQPIVLICPRGEQSRSFSQELRDKGFINVYFVKKGFQSLS